MTHAEYKARRTSFVRSAMSALLMRQGAGGTLAQSAVEIADTVLKELDRTMVPLERFGQPRYDEPGGFVTAGMGMGGAPQISPAPDLYRGPFLNEQHDREIRSLIGNCERINAIKYWRIASGLGLREAKDAIDKFADSIEEREG